VAWLGAILTATSLPKSVIPEVDFKFADKVVHVFMYGVLAYLIARAMHNPPRTTRVRVLTAAFLLVVAFGAIDEWHQQFIKGRTVGVADWVADSAGGLIGAAVWVIGSRFKTLRTA
jgi:VanZ family protein